MSQLLICVYLYVVLPHGGSGTQTHPRSQKSGITADASEVSKDFCSAAVALNTQGVTLLVTGRNLGPLGLSLLFMCCWQRQGVLRLGQGLTSYTTPFPWPGPQAQPTGSLTKYGLGSKHVHKQFLMFEGFWRWRRISTPMLRLMVHLSMFQITQMTNIPSALNVLYFSTYPHNTYTIINQNSLTHKLNFPSHYPIDDLIF